MNLKIKVIHPQAIVETKQIGANPSIHPFAVIHYDVILGDNVVIHPFVVIESGVTIGNNVEIFPGTYVGKEPKGAGALSRTPKFEKKIVIGDGCAIGPNAIIYYDVSIGNNTLLGDGASIREESVIGNKCIISRYVTINYNVKIGDRTKIMDTTHITGNCIIGNDVFIGMLVSTANDKSIGTNEYDEKKIRGPVICDGVKIGMGANILSNIEIGKYSIIGANSVVTKNIPPYKLAIGIPAEIVKDVST